MATEEEGRLGTVRFSATAASRVTAFVAGILGAQVLSVLMALGLEMQTSRFPLEMLLGNLITGQADPATWTIGFLWHVLNGGIFALLYHEAFGLLGQVGAKLGALLSLAHWILAFAFGKIAMAVHPLLAIHGSGKGYYYWARMGTISMEGSLCLHLAFGLIVGATCAAMVPLSREKTPRVVPRAVQGMVPTAERAHRQPRHQRRAA